VKDEAGAPIAGADVTVRSSEAVEIRRAARTDAQGIVRWGDLPAGVLVYLGAAHPARGGGIMRYGVGAPADVAIVLPAGREHTGRVTDTATGAPLAGARVGMHWMLEPDTRTDEQGRYRLNGWLGEPYAQEIYAVADGYVMAGAALGAGTEHDFALERGIEVTGRLLGEGGKPVAGASLSALGGVLSLRGTTGTPLSRAHGTSDAKGEFRLAPLRAGTKHRLVVEAAGRGRHVLDFETAEGPTSLGDMSLPAPFTVAGVILDASGVPVPRMEVTIEDQGPSRSLTEVYEGRGERRWTDDLGRFRFGDLAPGPYRVSTNRRGGSSVSRRVVVKDADVLDVRLVFPDERPFVAWVVDDAGGPIPDVSIRVEHDAGSSFGLTDPKGRADLTVSGHVRKIYADSEAGYGEADPITDLPEGVDEARFVLPRWEEILGSVVDEAGVPVAGAIVEVRWGSAEPRKVSTSGHGRFHVSVPPGTVAELRVVGRYVPAPGGSAMMEDGGLVSELHRVAAGSRDLTIRATAPRRDATLRVRVLTPTGKPLQGARVTYQPQPMENRVTVETDAEGRAVLTDLPVAEIGVSAFFDPRRTGFMFPLWQKVTPAGQEIVLKCREAARLKGIVVDPDGKPLFAQVFALHEGQMFNAFADKQGRFEMLVPADAESLDLQAAHKSPDGQFQGFAKHRLADGEARIVIKPPE
jgi:protocatechuate 3,4-dioxygenase beta subunit